MQETWLDSWVRKIPWRKKWQPTPVFLPGESAWTEEPSRFPVHGVVSIGHDLATKPLSLPFFGCTGSSLLCAAFSSCGERAAPLIVVCRLCNVVASLVAEHGPSAHRLR